jgi:hypothetical protein
MAAPGSEALEKERGRGPGLSWVGRGSQITPWASMRRKATWQEASLMFLSNEMADRLPDWFVTELRRRGTQCVYVGIATATLQKRLIAQDLQSRGHSSFFRSLGAVLDFTPPPRSLQGKKNQQNYRFIAADTQCVTRWIGKNLQVTWHEQQDGLESEERRAIINLKPMLNIASNPIACQKVIQLREACRTKAIVRTSAFTPDGILAGPARRVESWRVHCVPV